MIRLFTDTSSNFSTEMVEKYNVSVIPFSYSINGVTQEYNSFAGFDSKNFYSQMRAGAQIKTSMINVVTFIIPFEVALKAGDDVIYIGMSGAVSGSAGAADIAAKELAERYPERNIVAIDSLGAGLGEGLLVIRASEMIKEGRSFYDVVNTTTANIATLCQYFTVDDLKYLKRGGRLSNFEAAVGILLNIKPVLTGDPNGRIVVIGKARGRKSAIATLAEKYDKLAKDKSAPIYINHADNEEGANELVAALRAKGFKGEPTIVVYEPVCGSHVGPGALALFFEGTHK